MVSTELVSQFDSYTTTEEVNQSAHEDMSPEAATYTTITSSTPCAESVAATLVIKC